MGTIKIQMRKSQRIVKNWAIKITFKKLQKIKIASEWIASGIMIETITKKKINK
jgi:hypothetical protein